MRHICISVKNISTVASSNSQWAFEEVSHTTLTPLGRFDVFAGRADALDNPGGNIVLVLGKLEAELKIIFF